MIEVKLLKFALNNLIKEEEKEGRDMMFSITSRNIKDLRKNSIEENFKTR